MSWELEDRECVSKVRVASGVLDSWRHMAVHGKGLRDAVDTPALGGSRPGHEGIRDGQVVPSAQAPAASAAKTQGGLAWQWPLDHVG